MSGSGTRPLPRLIFGALAAATLALSSVTGSMFLATPSAVAATLEPACDAARALLENDEPKEAIALIEALRTAAREQLDAGVGTPVGTATTTRKQIELRRLASVCPAEFEEAQIALAAPAPDPTGAQQAGDDWDAFVKEWVTPLTGPAIAALAVFVGLLIIARLAVLLPVSPRVRVHRWALRLGYVVGLALLAGVAALTAAIAASPALAALRGAQWAAGLIPVAIIGVVLVAAFLGGRSRIGIEVLDAEGKPDAASTTEVIALLTEFGAASPGGVELPSAPDVGALKDAVITDLPGGQLLSAVAGALQTLFSIVPWKITVTHHGATRASIVVRQNGTTFSAATVDLADYPPLDVAPGEKAPDPRASYVHAIAAGHILVALASRSRGFEGLYGSTDGTAVGLYSIAKRSQFADKGPDIRILAGALERDPDTYLADLGLLRARLRWATDRPRLATFEERISGELQKPRLLARSAETLRVRILYTHMIAARNFLAADHVDDPALPTVDDIRRRGLVSATEMVRLLKDARMSPLLKAFRAHVAASLNILALGVPVDDEYSVPRRSRLGLVNRWWPEIKISLRQTLADAREWLDSALASSAPAIAYDALCYEVQTRLLSPSPAVADSEAGTDQAAPATPERVAVLAKKDADDVRTRIKDDAANAWRIRVSIVTPEDLTWIRKDPELQSVQDVTWFKNAVKAAEEDLETLESRDSVRQRPSLAGARSTEP